MQVDIFDEREVLSAEGKMEEGAMELIQELGLKTMESGERINYPVPNKQQWFVIRSLFPERTKITEYAAGGIPLRVLKEIRSYKAEYPTHILLVCHQAQALVKDPVLIAYTGQYHWQATSLETDARDFRLVARWGDALDSWEQLAKRAATIVRNKVISECERNIKRMQRIVNEIDNIDLEDNVIPKIEIKDIPEGY